ncbi:TetR/AcrR family transcriptional regulator [Nocardiopsis suaedae]|uniref:TetR/AcrR family transcriptional regulator n=1 Tax=Nocardiopsis suaedae TaxID=3018444 RepID=A0ABT4TIF8_9ACTN|nr:TetR/AcrR family transcriptional regulator [Nocardiopsis suaedae]MDA2803892.1 TetR/AcrR family transcriptional regulator [Nocardiopsis suaedae]
MTSFADDIEAGGTDRRSRRRAETKAEILRLAVEEMAEHGAAGLSMSRVARRLGVQPPSLYKYFDSRMALYDALFGIGQRRYLRTARRAAEQAPPGLAGFAPVLRAGARWSAENPVLAQLMFWRTVPGFAPSEQAYAPALELRRDWAARAGAAVERGELGAGAAGEEGLDLLASLIAGMVSMQLSNEPGAGFEGSRFLRHVDRIPALFAAAYPPPGAEEAAREKRARTT